MDVPSTPTVNSFSVFGGHIRYVYSAAKRLLQVDFTGLEKEFTLNGFSSKVDK